MKGIVGTDLQTLSATCADGDKLFFRQGTGRTDEPVILQSALRLERIGLDHQCGNKAKGKGSQDISSREVYSIHCLPTGHIEMKGDSPGRAFETFETGDTVLLAVVLGSLLRNGSHRTLLYTLLTVSAIIGHGSFENPETGKDRKEGPQRAEITAPEPFPDHSEGQDTDEKDENEEIDLEDGQGDGRHGERILWKKTLNLREKMIEDIDRRRVKGDDQGPGDQTDGIEKVHHLESHEARNDGENKDAVAKPSERLIVKRFGPLFFPEEESIEEVDDRSHGAEPPAEEVAEDHDKKEHPEGGKHPHDNPFVSKDRNDADEGIEPKIEVDRNLQLEGEGGLKDQIEKKEKGEGLNRPPQVRDYLCHVALTFLTRTFERSISPNPKSEASLTNLISSGLKGFPVFGCLNKAAA